MDRLRNSSQILRARLPRLRAVLAGLAAVPWLAGPGPVGADDQTSPLPVTSGDEFSTPLRSPPDEFSTVAPVSDDPSPTCVYVTLSGGLSTVGVTGLTSFTLEAATFQLTARAGVAGEFELGVSPTEKLEEKAVLVGKVWRRRPMSLHVAAGIATTKSVRRGRYLHDSDGMYGGKVYEELRGNSLGVPLEIVLTWHNCCVGGGVALVANLNPDLPLVGVVGTFRFGKLR